MALLSFQAFKDKWAAVAGRFRDNASFEIAENDYREFSGDLADSLFEPIAKIGARLDKLEAPIPAPQEGLKWNVFPKVSVVGQDVKVTASEGEFDAATVLFTAGTAKHAVPNPPADWGTRIDILAATSTGWAYIFGEQPGVTPSMVLASTPGTKLLFAAYLFWTSAGGEVEEPVVFVKTVNGALPDPNGNVQVVSGKVDTINGQNPDAQKNVLIGAEHIETVVNDAGWWGTAKLKLKGVADRLANEIKLLQDRMSVKADLVNGKIPLSQLTIDAALSATSQNPVQNKVITAAINENAQALGSLQTDQVTLQIYKHTNFNGF